MPQTVSVIVPGTAVAEAVSDFTSGKVVEDYVSDNIITPLRDTAVTIALLYAGMLFVIVGLLLLALNTSVGQKAARKGVSVATGGVI